MSHINGISSLRRLLASATAALAAGAAVATTAHATAVASPGGAGDHAELIRLCARQDEAWELVRAIQSERLPTGTPRGITLCSKDKEDRLSDADAEYLALVEEIAKTPATTDAGLRAKAQVMPGVLERIVAVNISARTLDDFATSDEAYVEDRMTLSFTRDVLAIVGRAAP